MKNRMDEVESAAQKVVEEEDDGEEEEEYVLIDLDSVSEHISIPPNVPYVLSASNVLLNVSNCRLMCQKRMLGLGLDTLNPIMIIDDKIKLIGEYEETIGTCLVFNETETAPVVHQETGPSEANLFAGTYIMDPKQTMTKQINPITQLNKVLKFKLLSEADDKDGADEHES